MVKSNSSSHFSISIINKRFFEGKALHVMLNQQSVGQVV